MSLDFEVAKDFHQKYQKLYGYTWNGNKSHYHLFLTLTKTLHKFHFTILDMALLVYSICIRVYRESQTFVFLKAIY